LGKIKGVLAGNGDMWTAAVRRAQAGSGIAESIDVLVPTYQRLLAAEE
jgi:hypothetical protein